MELIQKLVRPEILSLKAYESARSLNIDLYGKSFLDANESPTSACADSEMNRYPEPQPRILLERFSQIYGVSANQILVGRGSDEAIDLLVRVFCNAGKDSILVCPPTYGMYDVSAKIQGANIVRVPLQLNLPDASLDQEGIQKALLQNPSIKLIFVCSPNNPTGTAFSPEILRNLCSFALGKAIVVVDEAYAEFASSEPNSGKSLVKSLPEFPNLVVLRTLSKAWALAGARCGVAIGNSYLIGLLQKVRAPYPMSLPAIDMIRNSTTPASEVLLQERISANRDQREILKSELLRIPGVLGVYRSVTNFLLVKFVNSAPAFSCLKSRGIIVRDRSSEPGLENCIRITVGTEKENKALLATLQEASL